MTIDRKQPIPLYFQLKTLLLEKILSGHYGPGDRLPTEHELCELHGISRTPVTKALSELAEEGVILRHRRRGSFVNPHWVPRHTDGAELRMVVPEGPWEAQALAAAPADLRVNLVTVPLPDLHQFLTNSVAEGQAPDLALLDSVWVAEFSAAGFLWALEELDEAWISEEHNTDFLEPFVSTNRYNGRASAVQTEADVAGLWYRRAVLESIGLDPPSAWGELEEIAHAMVIRGIQYPIVLPGGSRAGETTTYCLLGLLASNGVTVLDADSVKLDSPKTVEMLRFARRLIEGQLLSPDAVAYEWDQPIRMLAQGRATISFGGSYEARQLSAETGLALDELPEVFGFVPIPRGPTGPPSTLAGGMAYGIFRQAAYPKLAMRLLKHLAAPETLAEMSRTTAQIPSRRSAFEQVAEELSFIVVTADMLERATVRPATPAHVRVSAQLQAMLEAVLMGRVGPSAAAERTAEMIAAITGLPVLHE